MAAVDRSGDGWYTERGKLEPTGEIFAEIARHQQAACPQDVSFLTYLQRDLRQLSVRARAFARRRVEGYDPPTRRAPAHARS